MAPEPFRVVIVDDEAPGRRLLRRLLADMPEFSPVAECSSGQEAIEVIGSLSPDLLLLDIHMPIADGFEVMRQVGINKMPYVIFVTAHDTYAVRAFEVNALDYLLKPVGRERFAAAMERARVALSRRSTPQRQRLRSLLKAWQSEPSMSVSDHSGALPGIQRLIVKDRQEIKSLPLKSIMWFEAADHYVTIHTSTGKYLIQESLSGLQDRLPSNFVRIHRRILVNTVFVAKVTQLRFGNFELVLQSGEKLRVSRTHREALRRFLNQ